MAFHLVNEAWSLKSFALSFLDTKGTGKSANDHRSVISAAISSNSRLGTDMLVFSAISNNEQSVSLRVDQYLNYSRSVRFIFHSISLIFNDAVVEGEFLDLTMRKINNITAYLSNHPKVASKLVELQCIGYSHD